MRAVHEKLVRSLGAGQGFGGDMPAVELPRYRYILGMERFDSDKNKLAEHVSFDQAVKTIRDNLDKGVARTSKVYEIVLPNEKIAVFGVAMHDPTMGDGSWVLRIEKLGHRWGKIKSMPKQPPKQRIILVDDHEVVRLGLKSLLERHPQFDVVGEAGSAREAIEKVESLKPDVVVMDIRLSGTSGIEACEQIVNNHPSVKVIMLTSYAEDEMLFSAIRAGASGYILKQIGSDDLVKALEAVGRGDALLDPAVTQRVFQEVRRAVKEEEASAFAHLSQQEKHVLLLVSEGKTNRRVDLLCPHRSVPQ